VFERCTPQRYDIADGRTRRHMIHTPLSTCVG
jgi:hypothetical protein